MLGRDENGERIFGFQGEWITFELYQIGDSEPHEAVSLVCSN